MFVRHNVYPCNVFFLRTVPVMLNDHRHVCSNTPPVA